MGAQDYLSTPPKVHSPTVGATISIDPTISLFQVWTPGQAETVNALSPGKPGQELTLVLLTSGVTNYAVTLGTNFSTASIIQTGSVTGQSIVNKFVSDGLKWIPVSGAATGGAAGAGTMITKLVTFTENATNTIHTGTVTLPPGSWLHDIQITNKALWTGGTATMKVGDSVDDDGFFVGVDLKATDLVLGEVLSMRQGSIDTDGMWGGKNGAYLVAATGRRGPTTTNFGMYYDAGSNIIGVVTVGTPATTVGRTFMVVTYSVGQVIPAVASA